MFTKMSGNYLDELREHFRTEKWFKNAENRKKKTEEQRELDKQFWDACSYGKRKLSVYLLKKGATNDCQSNGWSALHCACYKGDRNIATEIIQKYPEEIERKTEIGHGFTTPIGDAFMGGRTEIAKWLIQMGAQNPIHNAIWCGRNYEKAFEIIEETGKSLEYINKDLPRLKNLNLLTEQPTLNGIKQLIKFYEKYEQILGTIMFILLNLKFDNDPEKEQLWTKKRSEIIEQFPIAKAILMMDWGKVVNLPNGLNYLISILSNGHNFENESFSAIISKALNGLKDSNQKLDKEICLGLNKIMKLYENNEEITKKLIEILEKFNVDDQSLLVESPKLETKTLLKHLLDFAHREMPDQKISRDIGRPDESTEEISDESSNESSDKNFDKSSDENSNDYTQGWETTLADMVSKFCLACQRGDENGVNNIIEKFPFILDSTKYPTKEDALTPLRTSIQFSKWEIVKILIDNKIPNVIRDLIFANGTENEIDLQLFFDLFDKSKYFDKKSKIIQEDIKKMTKENMFSKPRMRRGLARLMKYFEQNDEITKIIENALVESEFIPEIPLLWRNEGRFPVEYFWRQNVNQKITLHRNNQIIAVNIIDFFL